MKSAMRAAVMSFTRIPENSAFNFSMQDRGGGPEGLALVWISGGRVALEFSAKCLKFPVSFRVSGNLAENGSLWTGSSATQSGLQRN